MFRRCLKLARGKGSASLTVQACPQAATDSEHGGDTNDRKRAGNLQDAYIINQRSVIINIRVHE